MITAKEAREKANKIKDQLSIVYRVSIEQHIIYEMEKGGTVLEICRPSPLHQFLRENVTYFTDLGYKVSDLMEDSIFISWY